MMATVKWFVTTSNVDRGCAWDAIRKLPDAIRGRWEDEFLKRSMPCEESDDDAGWMVSFMVTTVDDMAQAIALLKQARAMDVSVTCTVESEALRSQGAIGRVAEECTGSLLDRPQKSNVAKDALKVIESKVHELKVLMSQPKGGAPEEFGRGEGK